MKAVPNHMDRFAVQREGIAAGRDDILQPHGAGDLAQRTFRPVADDGGGKCGMVAAVFFIEMLDH